jgi:thiol-disulfide isomerase/thioredoxin
MNNFDFYRHIPKDLTESSSHGAILSICASIFMVTLFVLELWAFMAPVLMTDVILEPNTDNLLRINFNITVLDTPCDYAAIDIVDVLGTRNDNVTKNINKWQVDEFGRRANFEGRNRVQRELEHDTHHDLEVLKRNGIHAVTIGEADFDKHLSDNKHTFVNFYAPWCVWCQRLEPVWEAFAERVEADKTPVSVVKVDCVASRDLCVRHRIQAFPLLRMFKGKEPESDYRSDRTVDALSAYAADHVAADLQLQKLSEEARNLAIAENKEDNKEHPGCMMTGYLLVNRVPGNFHIESRSVVHNLNPVMANLSHVVNHLSFGPVLPKDSIALLERIPPAYFDMDKTHVIDGAEYHVKAVHQAYHHYIKVVSTHLQTADEPVVAYQMIHSGQVMQYGEEEIPEARFSYDISPMAVLVSRKNKKLYEFLTSICAVIGGTFTVVGLFNGVLSAIFKSKKL